MNYMLRSFRAPTCRAAIQWLAVIAGSCSLAACGGGGGKASTISGTTSSTIYIVHTIHTIGGTVSGVTAGGLVLLNSGTQLTVDSGSKSFTFPTRVTAGTPYAVTVQSSPPGLTCNVANGSGTVGGTNVTNIVVTCSSNSSGNSYTVRGTISGLSANGLVLTDGTDKLPVSSGASEFTMPTALTSGSSFTLSVATQPIGMNCSVTNGTGTVSAATVTSVQVSCTALHWVWQGGSPIGGSAGNPNPLSLSVPSARAGQMAWTDKTGRFWLFGGALDSGVTTTRHNDVWIYDPTAKSWTIGAADAPASYAAAPYRPGARSNGMAWADASGNLWLFGGLGTDSQGNVSSYLNDLWYYNTSSGPNVQWTLNSNGHLAGNDFSGQPPSSSSNGIFSSTYWPSAREGAATWVDNSGRLWMFGGFYSESSNAYILDDLWVYDPAHGEWARMSGNPVNSPGSYGSTGKASSTNSPGARFASATWTDSAGHLWLFGGGGYDGQASDPPGALNDLWMLDPSSAQWTFEGGRQSANDPGIPVPPSAPGSATALPSARAGAVAWTDAAGNFWMFGGHGDITGNPGAYIGLNNFCSDLWMFSPSNGQWTWVNGPSGYNTTPGSYGTVGISAPGNQPGSRVLASGWTDSSGHLWMFGGSGFGSDGVQNDLNDLWSF